jgi:NAD-dependent dihydropyrimidine dehydrogenase PreA subunit
MPKYLKNVATLQLKTDKCLGCGNCLDVCPHNVFGLTEEKAKIIQKDFCMECGACALNCPAQAIEVKAGVGCADAIIFGWITGNEPACNC